MTRIKLYAFFGKNLGDDLMVDILLKRYPQYRFYYDGSEANSDLFLQYPNFENRTPLLRRYGKLNYALNVLTGHKKEDFLLQRLFLRREKKSFCGILIGGSMFMQFAAEPERQVWWEELRFGKLPRFVIGVNFGPYRTEAFREAFGGYFCRCRGVTFRDRHSYRLFAHHANAAYAPDVVLNLPAEEYLTGECDGTVLISVIDVGGRAHLAEWTEDYQRFIIDCCETSIRRGKRPVLMSFCQQEGDENAIGQLMERMSAATREKTEKFFYHGNLEEALRLFARANYVIATRFHAMILALRFHKPFFSIAYSDKVKWVLDDLDFKGYCGMEQLSRLSADSVMDTYCQPVDAQAYIQQAARQFEQFDAYMQEKGK